MELAVITHLFFSATDLPTSTSLQHLAILCEQIFLMIDFFFNLMFPLAVLADCKLTHSLEYSDKCLSQDLYSHVNQKYFCQFGAMLSLKSADDYSLYGDSTLFLSVKQLWKLTAKPEHFFS